MKKWFISQFDGNGSSFPSPIGRGVRWLIAVLAAGSLLGDATALSQTAPTASLIYDAFAPIHGGVATGPDGVIYFATLSTVSNGIPVTSKVRALSGATLKWPFDPGVTGSAGDFHPVPSVDAAGQHVFVGSDSGRMYCLNSSDGTKLWQYPDANSPALAGFIRSSAALDPNAPNAPGHSPATVTNVYFQANDGYLYALDAWTGALRWQFQTGNQGGGLIIPYSWIHGRYHLRRWSAPTGPFT